MANLKTLGASAGAALVMTFAPAAYAEDAPSETNASLSQNFLPHCLPLEQSNAGITHTVGSSASILSEKDPGLIVISAIAGPDMGDNPRHLVKLFRSKGLGAECVISEETSQTAGTSYTFYIDGFSIPHNEENSWGSKELRENPDILRAVDREAKLTLNAPVILANN